MILRVKEAETKALSMLFWLFAAMLVLAGLLLSSDGSASAIANLPPAAIAMTVLAVLLGLYLLATRTTASEETRKLRTAAGLIAGALCLGLFGFGVTRFEPSRLFGILARAPANETNASEGLRSVMIRRNEQGQFLARGEINGQQIDMLIDTGATSVVIKASDAERAGIATGGLNYSVPLQTANGQVYAAPVTLRSISVGPIRQDALEVLVAKPGNLNENLLGMSFLTRLRSYEIKGNFITLRE